MSALLPWGLVKNLESLFHFALSENFDRARGVGVKPLTKRTSILLLSLRFARPSDSLAYCVLLLAHRLEQGSPPPVLTRCLGFALAVSGLIAASSLCKKSRSPSPRRSLSVTPRPTRRPRRELCRLAQGACQQSRHAPCYRYPSDNKDAWQSVHSQSSFLGLPAPCVIIRYLCSSPKILGPMKPILRYIHSLLKHNRQLVVKLGHFGTLGAVFECVGLHEGSIP